jgi:hypothetical protein
MRKRTVVIGICALALIGIGAAPRYLEELRIGGGYGDAADGGADFDKSGNIATDGSVKATGEMEAGKDSTSRGLVTAWDGAGTNAPGTLKLGSTDGTAGYVFMSNDRSGLRISSSLPTSDTDGNWLKAKTVTDLSSPPAIGGTTPASGKFTTLEATGAVTASSASNAINVGTLCTMTAPPDIGSTTPNGVWANELYARDDATLIGSEVVTNGDMEAASTWVAKGTPTSQAQSSEQKHAGTYSWKIVSATSGDGIYQNLPGAYLPGARFAVTFWYYGTGGSLTSRIYGWTSSSTQGYTTVTPAASWQSATYYVSFAAANTCKIDFYIDSVQTFYIDDVTVKLVGGDARVNGTFGVGGAAYFNAGQVTLASAYPSASDRLLGSGTNAIIPVSRLIAQTTGDMVDGFGPSFQFEATDSGASNKVFGGVGAVRDGADTEGKAVIYAGTNGAEPVATFDHNLLTTLAGGLTVVNDATVEGGDLICGVGSQTRGVLTAYHGASGNTPGVLKLASPNGTVRYFFAEDDGTLKVHSALPGSNSDGIEVGSQFSSTVTTFTTNDTTPSISGGRLFRVPGTWTTGNNITMFDSAVAGQEIVVIGGDSDCVVVDGGHLALAGNWTAAAGKTLRLVFDGTDWYETSRADN